MLESWRYRCIRKHTNFSLILYRENSFYAQCPKFPLYDGRAAPLALTNGLRVSDATAAISPVVVAFSTSSLLNIECNLSQACIEDVVL
jgi:hypothetical protein